MGRGGERTCCTANWWHFCSDCNQWSVPNTRTHIVVHHVRSSQPHCCHLLMMLWRAAVVACAPCGVASSVSEPICQQYPDKQIRIMDNCKRAGVTQTRTLRRRRRIRRNTKQCGWEEEDAKQTSTSSATVHNAEYLCFSATGNPNICCSNIN